MLVLGIETTCDETAASVVEDGRKILSNVIASQADLHALYGGVYPELACRRHLEALLPVIDSAIREAGVTKADIDLIAVAKGPGLIGALLLGLEAAKALSIALKKPFVGVNHVEAHLYAALMSTKEWKLPALGIVLSGGHTFLTKIDEALRYEVIGKTVDDAIGEAFDKVGVMLGLPYPGGPKVEESAQRGDPTRFPFKPGRVKSSPLDFSFSGLKTKVLYTLKGQNEEGGGVILPESEWPHVAAAFQEAALGDIVSKAKLALETFECRALYLGGGVCQNKRLRALLEEKITLPIFWPPSGLCLDNAAMIAGLGYEVYRRKGEGDELGLEPMTRIPL